MPHVARSGEQPADAVEVPAPRDADGIGIAVVGTALWAVAGVALLLAGEPIASALPALDLDLARRVCLAGTILGIVGIVVLVVRRRLRRGRDQEWPRSRRS